MKTSSSRDRFSQRGITLVEVVAVIGILFVLAALLFTGPVPARESARRAKAQTILKDIITATENYKTDYGRYPRIAPSMPGENMIGVGLPAADGTTINRDLFDVLRAIPRGANAKHALNARQTKYFEQPRATDPKHPREGFADGSQFPAVLQGTLFDPWGTPYCIVFETDSDGTLDLHTIYADVPVVKSGIVAFSLGKDGKPGGKAYPGLTRKVGSKEAPDDIISWEQAASMGEHGSSLHQSTSSGGE